MSAYAGEKEAPTASTRKDEKREVQDYRFTWVKRLVDKLFPPKLPNVGPAAGLALSGRKSEPGLTRR
jgi:hypothetical protein